MNKENSLLLCINFILIFVLTNKKKTKNCSYFMKLCIKNIRIANILKQENNQRHMSLNLQSALFKLITKKGKLILVK